MPQLDLALVADYVRVEAGVAHVIAAGIDTITAPTVPTGQNLGLLFRIHFTHSECDRPHRVEVLFQDEDGTRLAHIATVVTPQWSDTLPAHWPVGMVGGLNIGVPFPQYGLYAFEILINDSHAKTIRIRVVAPDGAGATEEGDSADGDLI